MNVKEAIRYLEQMPSDAIVVSAEDIKGAWTVLSAPSLTKYREPNVCVFKEAY